MRINEDTDGRWVCIGRDVGWREPAFQCADEDGFRVFTDPAGHPFCLVYG